jgi:hypothetical protein
MSKSLVGTLIAVVPCTCGGEAQVIDLTEPPAPGVAPTVITHTEPPCALFVDTEADAYLRQLRLARAN